MKCQHFKTAILENFNPVDNKYDRLVKVFLLHLALSIGHDSSAGTAFPFNHGRGCSGSEERGVKINELFLLQEYFILVLCSLRLLVYMKFSLLCFSPL